MPITREFAAKKKRKKSRIHLSSNQQLLITDFVARVGGFTKVTKRLLYPREASNFI